MPATRARRSISLPIVLSSITVALSIALLVGWVYVILKNLSLTKQVAQNAWLLSAGIVSFAVIVTVLILFTVFLAREIKEVRRQTSFIDSVTHELRSPLAALRLCLQTLEREGLSVDQQKQLQDMMRDDVARLSGFIEDILQASRLEHKEARRARAAVDLRALIERVAAQVRQRYRITNRIRVDMPDHVEIVTDGPALEVIVKNLLDNAVKYSTGDAPIEVEVTAGPSGWVQISVRDHGLGIRKGELRRVFDRFYRAPSEDVRARSGTGLGLFVVWSYVKQLGGKIRADSEGPGKGTKIIIQLPPGPSLSSTSARQSDTPPVDDVTSGPKSSRSQIRDANPEASS